MNAWLAWLITNDITPSEVILNTLLAIVGVGVIVSLWRLHAGNGIYKNFNLVHLIVNKDGYPDGAKCVEMGTFVLLSWGFIVYVTAKTLPEWYMQFYLLAFVLRGAYGAYLRSKGEPDMPLGTKVTTDTTIKTVEVKEPGGGAIAAQDVTVQAEGDVSVERKRKKGRE